jgi:hypothetical protein
MSRSTVRQSFTSEANPARAAEISTITKANSKVAYGASQAALPELSSAKPKTAARNRSTHATAQSPKYTTRDCRHRK